MRHLFGRCPLSIYMDFAPRRIIALVRKVPEDALSSQTIWLCASCYACAVLCPRQIHITDVMYSLKRRRSSTNSTQAVSHPGAGAGVYRMVRRRGRISEFRVVLRLALRTNPLTRWV
jgi:heterodisulfide reductase subunit C